jgi:hypothetical protein
LVVQPKGTILKIASLGTVVLLLFAACEKEDPFAKEKKELENLKLKKNAIAKTRVSRIPATTINGNQNWYNLKFPPIYNAYCDIDEFPYENSKSVDTVRADIDVASLVVNDTVYPNLQYMIDHKNNCVVVLSLDSAIVRLNQINCLSPSVKYE